MGSSEVTSCRMHIYSSWSLPWSWLHCHVVSRMIGWAYRTFLWEARGGRYQNVCPHCILPPPPSLPWSARTVGASHTSPPVVSVHSHHHCFLDVFSAPHQTVFDPSPYRSSWSSLTFHHPERQWLQQSSILQIWPNSWSFLCLMVSITVHSRCTCLLTSLLMWSCHIAYSAQ